MVRQEFIPTGVDEAEFEMQVTAPEGTSLAAMDDIMRAIERDVRSVPGVGPCCSTTGGGNFSAASTAASGFVPHRAARGAHLLAHAAVEGHRHARSAGGVPRQLQPARRDAADPRAGCAQYTDLRVAVRNIQSFNIGGGNHDFDFVIRGPELEKLAEFGEALRRRAPRARPASTPTSR